MTKKMIFLLPAFLCFAFSLSAEGTAAEWYEQGRTHLDNGSYDKAVEAFTEAIRLKPDHWDAWFNRALAFGRNNDYDSAIAGYNEVLRANPNYPELKANLAMAHNRRGKAYVMQGDRKAAQGSHEAAIDDYDRAIADYNEVLRINPGYPELKANLAMAHNNRGLMYGMWGDRKAALENHEAAIADYDRAIADWNEVLRVNPDYPELKENLAMAHYIRGLIYVMQGGRKAALENHEAAIADYDRAIVDLNEVFRVNPDYPKLKANLAVAHYNRGLMYGKLGDRKYALENHGAAIADYDRSIADWDEALRADPDYPELKTDLAMAHKRRGDVYAGLGKREEAIADYKQAIDGFTEVLQDNSNDSEAKKDLAGAHNNRGNMYIALGNPQAAIADYNHTIDGFNEVLCDNPDDPEAKKGLATAHNNRGRACADLGKREEAIADYNHTIDGLNEVLRDNPDDTEAKKVLAGAHNNRGNVYIVGKHEAAIDDYERAISRYNEVLLATPDDPEAKRGLALAHTNRGALYADLGDPQAAIADYKQAIDGYTEVLRANLDDAEAKIGFAGAHNNRGLVHTDLGDPQAAIADYKQAIDGYTEVLRAAPGDTGAKRGLALAHNNRGNMYIALGNPQAAIADYGKAIDGLNEVLRANPDDPDTKRGLALAHNNRGNAYADLRNHQAAADDFTAAIAHDPNFAPAHWDLGQTHADLGNPGAAEDHWKRFLGLLETESSTGVFSHSWGLAVQLYRNYPYLSGALWQNTGGRERVELIRRALALGIEKAEAARSGGARGALLMSQVLYLYYAAVDLEAFFDNPSKAFEYSESLRSRGFLEQLGTEAALRLPELAPYRDRIRELLRRIETRQNILAFYAHRALMGEDIAAHILAKEELAAAEGELAALDEKIIGNLPPSSHYGELRRPRPVGIEKAAAFCGPGRAVLEYVLWDAEGYIPVKGDLAGSFMKDPPAVNSYCLVLANGLVTAVRLDPAFGYAGQVEALRRKIIPPENEAGAGEEDFEAECNALYEALIRPVLHLIPPETVKSLLIVPDGSLAFLPFDILRPKDGRDLGETYRVSLSPSVSVSVLASEREEPAGEPFLGFGGALYKYNYGTNDDGRPLYWTELGQSAGEVSDIKDYYFGQNSRVIKERDASEGHIKAMSEDGSLADYPVIHFACHGYFNQREPEKSGILLSRAEGEDGNLSVEEVMLLVLRARMVMLSACDTGRGKVTRGEGMVGLARSFMVAGARNVGVSLWKIPDRRTREFMLKLYRYVREDGLDFAEAYYQTRMEYRNEKKSPSYWAAFTMYE